jgi:hypothetical protein
MLGSAIDFYIPDAELADLRAIGLRLQRGGVGFYPSSGSPFIHVDTGGVRHWPRMTREQLARIFPDGKTVHIPADGKPMPGFTLAMAEIEARGGRLGPTATAMRDDGGAAQPAADGAPVKRFFASLFGRIDEEADDEAGAARSNRTRLPTATAVASAPAAPAPDQARPPARPMTVASLGPAVPPHAPQLKWTPGPSGVAAGQSAVPLPPSRPGDIGEVTASLPPAITGSDQPATEGRALAYAPADARFGPLPPAHTRLASATEPEPSLTRRLARAPEPAPQVPPALRRTADAAAAPVTMLGGPTLELVTELHHPDLVSLRGLVEPVRAALAVRFDGESIEAPSTARFAGPAVVALQTLAFDRSAGIVTGALVSRATQVR